MAQRAVLLQKISRAKIVFCKNLRVSDRCMLSTLNLTVGRPTTLSGSMKLISRSRATGRICAGRWIPREIPMNMIRKGQIEGVEKEDITGQVKFIV
jgi:hypothetical protein